MERGCIWASEIAAKCPAGGDRLPEARLSPDVPHSTKMSENVNYSIHLAVTFMPR